MRHPQPDIEDLLKAAAAAGEPPVAPSSEKDASWALMRGLLDANGGPEPPSGGGGFTFGVELVVLLGTAGVMAWFHGPAHQEGKKAVVMEEVREMRDSLEGSKITLGGTVVDDSVLTVKLNEEDEPGDAEFQIQDSQLAAGQISTEAGEKRPGEGKNPPGKSVSGKNRYHGPRGISYARRKNFRDAATDESVPPGSEASTKRFPDPAKVASTSRNKPNNKRAGSDKNDAAKTSSNTGDEWSATANRRPRRGSNYSFSNRNANDKRATTSGAFQTNSREPDRSKRPIPPGRNDATDFNHLAKDKRTTGTASTISDPGIDSNKLTAGKSGIHPNNQTTGNPNPGFNSGLTPIQPQRALIAPGLQHSAGRRVGGAAPSYKAHRETGRLSLRLATSLSSGSAFGAGFFAEYSVFLGNRFLLRPYAGARFFTGKEHEYQLTYYKPSQPDSPGRYPADSGYARFKLRNATYAVAGIPLAIQIGNWEISTGIAAHFRLGFSGSQQNITRPSNHLYDSRKETPDFRRSAVPGSFALSWQAGVDYRISPQWRAGAQYQLRFAENTSGTAFILQPAQAYPGRQLFSLHLRYYFRKK